MKRFQEKFKAASTPKKILFTVSVLYIIGSLFDNSASQSNILSEELGTAYFVTLVGVYLVKFAAVFLAVTLITLVTRKVKRKDTEGEK